MKLVNAVLPGKKILVYDVAASTSGALSVLNDFYEEVKQYSDKTIQWIFVVSIPALEETENIKVVRMPWVKKSWLHRMYCDWLVMPKFVINNNIDKIFSLQNVIIPRVNVDQVLYMHQSLPFSKYRFKFFVDFKLWVYQNIIGKFICISVSKAKKIIVQTNWIKKGLSEKVKNSLQKIIVVPPTIDIAVKKNFSYANMLKSLFIYPATPLIYKNHAVIVEACKLLQRQGINDYRVLFTMRGDENIFAQKLKREAEQYNLPIEFIGVLKREKLFDLYNKSILLFPSYIETFGMPLMEAKLHSTPIIAGKTDFAEEILQGYDKASFFECNDAEGLMGEMISLQKRYYENFSNSSCI